MRALNKTAAKSKDKENLFADESPYPAIVQQKNAIKIVEGVAFMLFRRNSSCGIIFIAGELSSYKQDIRKMLKVPTFEYTKVCFFIIKTIFILSRLLLWTLSS